MSERITVERRGPVVIVTLNRPKRHNAVDPEMLEALIQVPKTLRADRSLRCVILRGDGPSFCSGLDFPQFTKRPLRLLRAFFKVGPGQTNHFQRACWAWRELPVPVIAALHGRCYGAGLQLALAADFRLVTPSCELSILEAKWGLIPDMSGTVPLRELIGMDHAKLLTMTGRTLLGEEARQIGLVTAVYADPFEAALILSEELITRSPDSIAATKQLFHQNWSDSVRGALARERRLQAMLLAGQNMREAMSANFKKRAPRFGPRSRFF